MIANITGPAKYLRLIREAKAMSQDELASMLGWKHTRISDIERGKNALTTTTISRIAAAMGMTDDEFYSLGSRLSQEQGQ